MSTYEYVDSEPDLRDDPDYIAFGESLHNETISEQDRHYVRLTEEVKECAEHAAIVSLTQDDMVENLIHDASVAWSKFENTHERDLWDSAFSGAALLNEIHALFLARFWAVAVFSAWNHNVADA
jgi:hypothetical protein